MNFIKTIDFFILLLNYVLEENYLIKYDKKEVFLKKKLLKLCDKYCLQLIIVMMKKSYIGKLKH